MLDYEITAEEVQAKLKSGEMITLLDCREQWEYEVAHIQIDDSSRGPQHAQRGGVVKHIPMGEIPARANNELDPEAHIVVLCHHGVRSMNVTAWLRQQGFEMVQSMRGGIDHWSRAVDPSVPLY